MHIRSLLSPCAPAILGMALCLLTVQDIQARRPRAKYVIVVSMDGFRHDYADRYNCPTLQEMAVTGVSGTMLPSYPASTFPNHYSIATGLVPDHHGIVNNSFWAPDLNLYYSMSGKEKERSEFWFGDPIWNTAQRQGLVVAATYWVGAEYLIGGGRPRYYREYGKNMLTYEQRTDSTLAMLRLPKKQRPHLLMLYYNEPDHTGHEMGPNDPATGAQAERVDSMIARLRTGIKAMGLSRKVDLIVLSDHGMAEVSSERCINPDDYLKPTWYEHLVYGTPTSIFSKNAACRDSILAALRDVEHISVWKKEEIPPELCYGTSPRIGDIIVAPDCGWQFRNRPSNGKGAHGFFPYDSDMQTVFRAEGPDFKKGFKAEKFRNVSIYPLVCHLLRIKPSPNDGNLEEVKAMLR